MSAVLLLAVIFYLIERYRFNKAIDRLIAKRNELRRFTELRNIIMKNTKE